MPEPPSSDSCEQSSWRPGHSQGIEIHMKALPHILAHTAISHDFSQVMGGGKGRKKSARDKTAELYAIVRPIFKGQLSRGKLFPTPNGSTPLISEASPDACKCPELKGRLHGLWPSE